MYWTRTEIVWYLIGMNYLVQQGVLLVHPILRIYHLIHAFRNLTMKEIIP